jgi:hypothetical protein
MAFTHSRLRAYGTTAILALAAAVHGGVVLGAPKPPAKSDPWRVVSTINAKADQEPIATIRFANGHLLTPHLYHPAVIGTLPSAGATPYLVLDGIECTECDATARSVYVGDPRAWPKDFSKDGWAVGYPSRNYSASGGKLMSWSRVFIGRCLSENPGVVSFYSAREEKGWSHRADWVEVVGGRLVAHAATAEDQGVPRVAAVAKSVRAGRCREVHAQTTDEGDYG